MSLSVCGGVEAYLVLSSVSVFPRLLILGLFWGGDMSQPKTTNHLKHPKH